LYILLLNGGFLRISTGGTLRLFLLRPLGNLRGGGGEAASKPQLVQETIMAKSFGAESTTDEVLEDVSLTGKRVLVTGVSAGLGVETARALAAHGAEVVGAARHLTKAQAATAPVRADAANGGSLELVQLDLASLASVRACADALVANGKPFDLVTCNAGVMATPFGKTADGV
jgi:short chain dehydrogenase